MARRRDFDSKVANADYVGAAVNTGLMGLMTAASFAGLRDLRNEIRRASQSQPAIMTHTEETS